MESCYSTNSCNCVKDCQCPSGYDCCTESDNPARAKPTFGMCVQEGTCDRSRGICKSKNPTVSKSIKERFKIFSREGYNDDDDTCKSWKGAFWFLAVIIFIMLFCIISMSKKY